ncbi:hypothetical protein FACS1894111_03560 [Clostridia bacterium]|nr:hypothetical protein FACS1894111_03560 [Clostridia bacterium]
MIQLDELQKLPVDRISLGYAEDGAFIIPGLAVITTTECNLHCKLCVQKTSYIKGKMFRFPQLKAWLDEVFEIADYVIKLSLGGGEPLINSDLTEILLYLNNYRNRIGSLRIVTNATILPNEDLIQASAITKCNWLLADYPVKNRLSEIVTLLENNNIEYQARDYRSATPYMDGWVDFGDFKTKHERHGVCPRINQYINLVDGKLFACGMEGVFMQVDEKAAFDRCRDSSIDLENHNETVSFKREKLISARQKGSVDLCEYCNGNDADCPRFTPGEQLTPQELVEIRKSEM